MKKRFRILTLILLITCMLSCFILVSCSSCKEDLYEPEKAFKLNYSKNSISLFDSFELKVKGYEEVQFSSSDENIVTVSEEGLVYANAIGTATVTVSAGDKSDDCIVTVKDEGLIPSLKFNILENTLSMLKDENFTIKPCVEFNKKVYEDFTVTYSSSSPNVVDISENGLLTAKSKGTSELSIVAEWRGFDSKYLSQTIKVDVSSDISMNVSVSNDTVYTVSTAIDGNNYENQFEVYCNAKVDGVPVDSSDMLYNFDSELLSRNGNVFTALKRGNAEISVSVEVDGKKYTSLPISVNILAPEINVKETYFVKVGGDNLSIDGLIGNAYKVSNGDYDYTSYTTFESGKVSLNTTEILNPRGRTPIFIETDLYSYVVDVYFGTHVIRNKTDFINFSNSYGKGIDANTDYWYVVLANDIDMQGATIYKTWEDYFRGIFDGAGNEISNVKTKEYGIFGFITRELKNVSFYNVSADGGHMLSGYVYGKVNNVYLKGSFLKSNKDSTVLTFDNRGLIENSVFDVTHNSTNGYVIGRIAAGTGFVKNVIAMGNSKSFSNDPLDTFNVYDTANDFVQDKLDDISNENGFNNFWTTDEYGVYFNGKSYIVKQATQTLENTWEWEDFNVDVYEVASKKPDKIYINRRLVDVPDNNEDLNIKDILSIYFVISSF